MEKKTYAAAEPKLTVWYGPMPESNGKTNWTAILHKGDVTEGITIDCSEYPDRVRYEADRMRWMIGELDADPWILDYDADKHSGYVAPTAASGQKLTNRIYDAMVLHCEVKGYPVEPEVIDELARVASDIDATEL
jgi:hypothetical protein